MTGSTILGGRFQRVTGVFAATVLACAGCAVASTVAPPTAVTYGAVTTIAGGGNGPVSSTPPSLGGVQGMARFGNTLYFGTNGGIVIARNVATGEQTLYAGSQSQSGYAGDGGPAADALLLNVGLMAVDSAGNLYAYETGQAGGETRCDIRRIDAAAPHNISTYAGGDVDPAQACHDDVGDGGPADLAGIQALYAMAFDSHDNLFIASNDGFMRRIDQVTHVIDTYAGSLSDPPGYIDTVDPQTPRDARFGDGITGFAFDATDHLYIADINNSAIRMIDTGANAPVVTTVAGGTMNGSLGSGNVDGSVTLAQFNMLSGGGALALSPTTNELYISDGNDNKRIRSLSADRTEVTTIAGDGTDGNPDFVGPALGAGVNGPHVMTFDAAGGFYFIGNNDGQLRYIDTDGIISNRNSTPPQPGQAPFTGDGGQATDAIIAMPTDLVRIGSSLYVAESGSPDSGHAGDPGNRIRKIDLATGVISTFAGTGEQGFAGDGGAATAAKLYGPQSLASDGHSIYVSSTDARIRRINIATGIITTVAGTGTPCDDTRHACGDNGPATSARIGAYVGLAAASGGRLLIGDAADNRVRCVGCVAAHSDWMTRIAGTGTPGHSAAGTLAPIARVTAPYHVVVAPDNTIVFSEVTSGLVRRINANGTLSTVAGTANPDFAASGDNGPATSAKIAGPMALRYDAAGNLDIGQAGGNPFVGQFEHPAIRQVNSTTGIITTIAGNGSPGFSGDGGSAKLASFSFPVSFAPDDGTHLYVADMLNNRVRRIRATRPDLVTTTAVSVFKAGTTGTLTVNEQSANGGWVSGPVKAVVTLPTRLNYQSASGLGWTCRAGSGHTVICTHARGIAPRTTTPVTLRLGITGSAAATVSVRTTSTSNSDVIDVSHQSKTRTIHIVH